MQSCIEIPSQCAHPQHLHLSRVPAPRDICVFDFCRVNNLHTHDSVKPYVRSKGRKFEKARGRRRSNGFKVRPMPMEVTVPIKRLHPKDTRQFFPATACYGHVPSNRTFQKIEKARKHSILGRCWAKIGFRKTQAGV